MGHLLLTTRKKLLDWNTGNCYWQVGSLLQIKYCWSYHVVHFVGLVVLTFGSITGTKAY